MTIENEITENKALRRDGDALIQRVKALPPSRERSLTVTKLQESVMWLGMDLKRINEANPIPEKSNTDRAESLAQMVIEWVEGGEKLGTDWRNGLTDLIEKRLARFFMANPYPNSKDPSNTTIEPTADNLKL